MLELMVRPTTRQWAVFTLLALLERACQSFWTVSNINAAAIVKHAPPLSWATEPQQLLNQYSYSLQLETCCHTMII